MIFQFHVKEIVQEILKSKEITVHALTIPQIKTKKISVQLKTENFFYTYNSATHFPIQAIHKKPTNLTHKTLHFPQIEAI